MVDKLFIFYTKAICLIVDPSGLKYKHPAPAEPEWNIDPSINVDGVVSNLSSDKIPEFGIAELPVNIKLLANFILLIPLDQYIKSSFLFSTEIDEKEKWLNFNYFKGNKLWDNFKSIKCGGTSSTQINSLNLNQMNLDHTNAIFVVSNDTSRWLHYFTNPKNLKLQKEEIKKQMISANRMPSVK